MFLTMVFVGSELKTGFDCRVCGLHHDVLPLSYSCKIPEAAGAVPRQQWEKRVVITPDLCAIDERFYYVRGRFAIPVHGLDEPFIWGVWARVSSADFFRTNQMWTDPLRVDEPLYNGLLNNALPVYGDVKDLPLRVQTMPVGRRPHFFPVDTAHPLAMEIRDGISMERVVEWAQRLLHA